MFSKLPLRQPPKEICVLRLSAIGDICHTLPVIRTLQAAWPNTRITWIIGSLEASLIGDIEGIEFITFNKSAGTKSRQKVVEQLAGRRFDVLLHMQASLRSSQISRLIKARIKLGFDRERAKDFQWIFTNQRIQAKPRTHVIEGLFGFAEALGIDNRQYRWDIPLSEEDNAFAAKHCLEKTLIISPCSSQRSRNFRNWSAENYAAVADFAAEKYGMNTVLTGGPSELEQQYGREIVDHCKTATPTNLIGNTNLKQLLALIEQSTAVLAPDSGPIHMATAVNTPAIGLFAGSNPERTGPARDQRWLVNYYPEAAENEFKKPVPQIAWGRRVRDPLVMSLIPLTAVCEKLTAVMSHTEESSAA